MTERPNPFAPDTRDVPADEQINNWQAGYMRKLSMLCLEISGKLQQLQMDLDCLYDTSPTRMEAYKEDTLYEALELMDELYVSAGTEAQTIAPREGDVRRKRHQSWYSTTQPTDL